MRQFTHTENAALRDILKQAFDGSAFKIMLRSRLGFRIEDIAAPGNFVAQLFDVIETANMENWNFQLLNAALAARPNNTELQEFSKKTGLLGITDSGLQALVSKSTFYDATRLLSKLTELFGQVCRVEIQGRQEGTGFLVGPDLLMTNYHVAKKFIDNPALASQVTARFDYRSMDNGPAVYGGTPVKLADVNPVLDYKEYDKVDVDLTFPPDTPVPTDKLDYALLRLAQPIGNEPGGPRLNNETPDDGGTTTFKRGWIKYPNPAPAWVDKAPLFIVQHPEHRPLQVAFESQAILGTDPNKVRVRYNVNTEGGSSGSPCFNENWQWVALHHYGSVKRGYNQGVPADKIIAALPQALRDELSPETP